MKFHLFSRLADRAVKPLLGGKSHPLFAGLSQVVSAGGSFLISLILIKDIGVSDFGKFTVGALLVFVSKNFSEAVIFAPMASIGGKLAVGVRSAYRGFLLCYVILALFFIGTLVFVGLLISGFIAAEDWLIGLASATAFSCICSCLSDFLRRKLFLEKRAIFSFGVEIVRYLSQVIFIVGFGILFARPLTFLDAVYSIGYSSLLSSIVASYRFGNLQFRFRIYKASAYRHWRFIKWMILSVALDTVHTTFPFFYASGYLGPASLGLLRAAHQITGILNLPFNALMQVIPVMAANRFGAASPGLLMQFLRKISWMMVLFSLIMGVILLILADRLASYLHIVDVRTFSILLGLFIVINIVNAARFADMVFVNTMEVTSVNFRAAALGGVVGVTGAMTLTPVLGSYGVTLTFILVAIVMFFVLRFWSNRISASYN